MRLLLTKRTICRTISAASNRKDGGDSGMNWLMYELLWRDFFRQVNTVYVLHFTSHKSLFIYYKLFICLQIHHQEIQFSKTE